MNTTVIPGGEWEFITWCKVDNPVGTSEIVIRVYKRASGGTETELFNTTTGNIDETSVTEYSTKSIQGDFEVAESDRLLIKYFAKASTAASVTITLYYEGTEHYSHLHTPFTFATATDPDAIHKSVSSEFDTITAKTAIAATDLFLIEEAAGTKKKVAQINVDPFRPFTVTFGDGVNAIPNSSVIRVPIPFPMTMSYYIIESPSSMTSAVGKMRYYNGSSWTDPVFSWNITGYNAYSTFSLTVGTGWASGSRQLLEFWHTSGTAYQYSITILAKKTGNF